MSVPTIRLSLLALATAGVAAPLLVGPATAEPATTATAPATARAADSVVVTRDHAGDVDSGVDLRKVRLAHRESIRVVLNHEDLVRHPSYGVGASIYLDTDADQRGPEYEFVGGLFEGTDYMLAETDRWKTGDAVAMKDCFYIMKLDYDTERTVVRIDPDCVGNPDEVRIAVKATADSADGAAHDWLGSRRAFTSWVTPSR